MTTPGWSHPSLTSQINFSDEAYTTNPLRRNTMFRSYRHLPDPFTSYNSRISLQSNLPHAGTAPFRSHYPSAELPSLWLQRSSSERTIPLNDHSASVINLSGTDPIPEDDLLSPSPLYNRRPGSTEDFLSTNMDRTRSSSPTNMSNPCHLGGDLVIRRPRSNAVRFVPNSECNSGAPDAQISLTNRPSRFSNESPSQSPPAPPLLDRSIVFTNSIGNSNRSLRNVTLETGPRGGSVSGRLFPRYSQPSASHVMGFRAVLDAIDGLRPTTNSTNSPSSSAVRRREASLVNYRVNERPHSIPVRTAYRSRSNANQSANRVRSQVLNPTDAGLHRSNTDREIRVRQVFNIPAVPNSTQTNEAHSTTSSSGASSIEDVRPNAIVTPDIRRAQNGTKPTEAAAAMNAPVKASKESPALKGSDDWREDAKGSRELWRRILLHQRFVDVWFVVGGTAILQSSASSCIVSPDSGAPGGPTSATKYASSQPRVQMTTRPESEPLDVNHNHSSHPVSGDERNTPESQTLSQNTGTEQDLTGNETTDVGSDLDDIPSGQRNQSDGMEMQSVSISMSSGNLTASRTGFNSRGLVPGQNELQHALRQMPDFENRLQSSPAQVQHIASDVNVNPPMPLYRVSAPSDTEPAQSPVDGSGQPLAIHSDLNNNICCRFGAHKIILAAASRVFEAMFYGPVAEMNSRNSQTTVEYHIPDIHPRAFQSMLLYIYTDEIELDDDLDFVFYVLYAAKKYMLSQLGRRCVEHLKEQLTASNVCAMLDRSLFFDEEDLTQQCWHVIDVLATNVLTSPGLLEMDETNLRALLKRDTLNCKESEVFSAVRCWAAAECSRLGLRDVIYNRAQIAADLLHLVRFPTMTLDDFAENVAYSGFLSLEMVRDLFVHITTNNSAQYEKNKRSAKGRVKRRNNSSASANGVNSNKTSAVESEPTAFVGPFPAKPRYGPQLWRCTRFTRTGKHLITPNTGNNHQHSVVFQVSNSVFLAGIGLYGSTQMGENLTVRVELLRCSPKAVLSTGVTSVGTQYHGPADGYTESRIGSDSQQTCRSAPATRTTVRSSSLLEFDRNDGPGRHQCTSQAPNQNSLEDRIIRIPRDLSHTAARNTNNETRANSRTQDSNTLAVVQTHIQSDGSSRVYEVFFSCPVKVVRNVRYVIHVQTSHGDRVVSASSSSTAMNSSSLYIGLFGRREVRVTCNNEEGISDRPLHRSESSRKLNSREQSENTGDWTKTPVDSRDVAFHFSENAEGVENAEVDRGFLPELLFYTCS